MAAAERYMLDRIGEEVVRETSIVHCAGWPLASSAALWRWPGRCVTDAFASGDARERRQKLAELVEAFERAQE